MTMTSTVATYAAGERARCVAAVPSNDEQTVFAVGTQRLRGNNAVHFLTHDRDRNALVARGVYKHHPEIWDLQPSPTTESLLATLYNPSSGASDHGGAVWRVPSSSDGQTSGSLESIAPFPGTRGAARCVRWRVGVGVDPSAPSTTGTLAVVDATSLKLFDIDASPGSTLALSAASRKDLGEDFSRGAPVSGAWDPHQRDAFAICVGDGVVVYDARSMEAAVDIPRAHETQALCVEYDPRRRFRCVTGGDDGFLRAWDLRSSKKPMYAFSGHQHWTWCVRRNPVYDLLVSGSSDGTARLWRDEPSDGETKTSSKTGRARDASSDCVETYGRLHGNGVYCVAWSAADPWSFASLEGDGVVSLRVVPRAEKYRILL
jgi:WD40 repeat protein